MIRKSRAADDDLDITPMIDVTFLLLIFFMVSSTMRGTPDLPLPPARSGEGVVMDDAVVITLLSVDGSPSIHLGNGPNSPVGDADTVGQYITDAVASQKTTVVINADRDLPSGFVEDVARAANVEGVEKMFYGVEQKR